VRTDQTAEAPAGKGADRALGGLLALALSRSMVPFTHDIVRNFGQLSLFIAAGISYLIVRRDQPEQPAAIFESGGADVSMFRIFWGTRPSVAKQWLSETMIKNRLAV
jgi:hypothetical protein